MNDLEMQLASWVPRRPSASISERLFARRDEPAVREQGRVTWLVPAMAAALVAFCAVTYRPGGAYEGVEHSSSMVAALTLSNRNAAPVLPASASCSVNSVYGDNFEWTQRGLTSSALNFSSLKATNY